MGLLDKFKKKTMDKDLTENAVNDATAQPTEASTKETVTTTSEKTANDGRRFTFVVEDTFQLLDNQGIVVVGNLHGKIAVEDAVYIMHPNGQITLSVINGIEINKGETAQTAEDQPIAIKLSDIKDKAQIQKYTVLTSIRPQTAVDVNKAVENGQLLGLSMEFPRFNQDPNFMSLFVYVACHAHFITPVHINKEPERKGDGTAVFTKDTKMGFLSLTHPSDETKRHLPIFTDWKALRKWENMFNQERVPKVMVVSFPDVVALVKKDLSGAILNPFGPVPVLLSDEYIEKITSLEGYRAEFINKEKQDAKQVKVQSEEQILVGVPAETEEVKLIRETVRAVVTPNADINQVYMLLKLDHLKNKSYFLVVDCDKETEKDSFNQIAAAVKPYLSEVKYLDMISYEQLGNRIKGMENKGLIFDRATFWK